MMVTLTDGIIISILVLHLVVEFSSGLLPLAGRNNLMRQAATYTGATFEDQEKIVNDFEKKLLNMFGLKRRPSPGPDVQVPRIMQHLYKAHMGDMYQHHEKISTSWETGFDLPPDEVMNKVNTARSFHHLVQDESPLDLRESHVRLKFDLSTLPAEEAIQLTELLLHREAVEHQLDLAADEHAHRINVYEVVKPPASDLPRSGQDNATLSRTNQFENAPIYRLLDTRLIDSRNSSWEKFDVSPAAMRWSKSTYEANHGLLVEVVREKDGLPPQSDSIRHVRLKRELHQDLTNQEWQHRRPILLTYTHDGRPSTLQRSRRSSGDRSTRGSNSNSSKRRRRRKRRHCQRHDLYVDFKDVGWNDWIVAPHGYDAFYCQGKCPFPLSDHMNATNHAIVQTLVNSVQSSLAPKPCCVPTELDAISMLYLDELEMVVLKSYHQMVVRACGCR